MLDEEQRDTDARAARIPLADFDPTDARVRSRLAARTPGGGYAVPDTDLVRAIRGYNALGDRARRDTLFTMLLDRCKPMFRKMAQGLAHRPEWREDAIADMTVQLWREVQDPKETFMLQNFGYYLKCLCADNFNRLLRREGYGYRTNEQGQVAGRPEHVPAALIDSIDRTPRSDEQESVVETIADPTNPHDLRLAALEARRILASLPDPLDRRIVYLRVFQNLQWEEIAQLCGKTERTMRTRYERARRLLQSTLASSENEPEDHGGAVGLAEPPTKPIRRARARERGL